MSIYNHRAMAPALGGRIPELLETLKGEFDTLTQDVGAYHRQKDDVEHKRTTHTHSSDPPQHLKKNDIF